MKHEIKLTIHSCFDFERNIEDLIDALIEFKEERKDKYTRIYIDSDYDYDGNRRYMLCGTRLETDTEEKTRKAKDKSWKQQQEENERNQYERLKAKFDKESK